MKEFTDTLESLAALLERSSIKYAIMGGLAVRAYSIPRATQDIDLTVAMAHEQLPSLYSSLGELGFTVPDIYKSGWIDEVKGMRMVKVRRYVRDRGLDVDIFLADSAFQEELLIRRRLADVEGQRLWIASPEDIVLLKLMAGRTRDLVDVADVLFMQDPLDVEYMRRWAAELGVEQELERALAEKSEERP